jgi:hypothetical protein
MRRPARVRARRRRERVDEVDVAPQARAGHELDRALARHVPAARRRRRGAERVERFVALHAGRRIAGAERHRLELPLRTAAVDAREDAADGRPRVLLRRERDGVDADAVAVEHDDVERGPQPRRVRIARRVHALEAAGGARGGEQHVGAFAGHPADEAPRRHVLVTVEQDHGAAEGVERRERRARAERRHGELLAVGVGDERGHRGAEEPARDARHAGVIHAADVRHRRGDEVVMHEEQHRQIVVR